jgi:hypothetical protein
MSSSAAGSSASSGSATSTDIKAPLWDHVHITERAEVGGNMKWKCKYCNYNGFSSYTRVEAHLLQIENKGIASCAKVTHEILTQMRKEVENCKDLVERSRVKGVSMPATPSQCDASSAKKSKRGPGSMLERSWQMQYRKHLDALIAIAFYSGGIHFNFAINPYLREAFTFAASNSVIGYQMPGYNT